MTVRSRTKKERLAARLDPKAPKRVCKAPACLVVLSVYNDSDMCSSCFDAIPVNRRPYAYQQF